MKVFKKITIMALSLSIFLVSCQGGNSSMNTLNTEKSSEDDNNIAVESTEETSKKIKETTAVPENPYEREIKQASIWTKDFDDADHSIKGIENIRTVGLITGDGSENKTRTRFRVGGTDLGIPVIHNEQMYLWFGDTFWGDRFGKPMEGGLWRSNVLAISNDTDFSDGLSIDDMIGDGEKDKKYARELVESLKIPGTEHTVIPTGSVSIDGKLYVYFMSIKAWGTPGRWTINYGGLAVSHDNGETFEKLEDFKLNPDKFGQFAAILVDDYVYGIGIGGGRFGNAYLARVKQNEIENLDAYEYLVAVEEGKPVFDKDSEKSMPIIKDTVGEPSIMWNEYLQEYVITYFKESHASIIMRTAKELWAPYSEYLVLASGGDFPALYGGFVHERMTKDNGKTFYYIMSMWDPVYNAILMEVTLK